MKTQQPKQPIGVIQSLTSGFDLVTRHPELMLLPILLDVFFWLGPRLSPYPMFRALIALVQSLGAAAVDAASRQQADALQNMLDQVGQVFNLFWWLSPTLLGVPSLMAGAPALKIPGGLPLVWPVSSALEYLTLFFVFSVVGLALSAAYWGMLSSRVRERPLSLGRLAKLWWGLCKIAILFVGVVLLIGFPTLAAATFMALFNSTVAQFLMLIGSSAILWVLFYLVFTLHGVALRDNWVLPAVWTSINLVRLQFLPTMGLLLLVLAVYIGLGLVWNIPPSDSWLKGAGILGHAFIATGLATATAVYYLGRVPEPVIGDQGSGC